MLPFIDILGFKLPTYGLLMLIAIYSSAYIVIRRCRKKEIRSYTIIIIFACAAFGVISGGSLLYMFITYPVSYIIQSILRLDFSIFKTGLVFYGGLFGGAAGMFFGTQLTKTPIYLIEDEVAPTIPFCHAIGRIGCLLAGCCYGREYSGLFAVKNYVVDPGGVLTFFPVQLVEASGDILIAVILYYLAKKPHEKYSLFFDYIFLYGILRLITEMLRDDDIRGIYYGFSTSQWISMALIGIFIIYKIMWIFNKRKRKADICYEKKGS